MPPSERSAMAKRKKHLLQPDNDNDREYPVADENGRTFDWFVDGVADYLDGRETDLGTAIGRHLARAERAGKAPKPIPGGKPHGR